MFGLGKLFSGGLFGKFFDSIGLGWMGNALSLATNVMTGNWLAAAKDVFDLVSRFSNNSWQNRVSPFQPLGDFDTGGGCFGRNSITESRVTDLSNRANTDATNGLRSYTGFISVTRETVQNNAIANAQIQAAQIGTPA